MSFFVLSWLVMLEASPVSFSTFCRIAWSVAIISRMRTMLSDVSVVDCNLRARARGVRGGRRQASALRACGAPTPGGAP